jgi:replicative DNA helicase
MIDGASFILDDGARGPDYGLARMRAGGDFILDSPTAPSPVWGEGQDVLWAEGEALIVAGPQGLGKTTLIQQLALGRCGIPEYSELLGFPIQYGYGRVLYLAMDRPKQAARSFRRMVGEAYRDELNGLLVVWEGPPPGDIAKHRELLVRLCERAAATTVVVDSLKDAAIGLNDDEVGAGYNRARQTAIAEGIEVIEAHHVRKAIAGAKGERPDIDKLYGSTWITSGAGSVLLLTGAPGDPIVGMHHLKTPSNEVGPMKVIHDHEAGRSTVWHATDLVAVASAKPGGISAVDAARVLFETEKPSPAEKEKARRQLDKLERGGRLTVLVSGDQSSARKWGA